MDPVRGHIFFSLSRACALLVSCGGGHRAPLRGGVAEDGGEEAGRGVGTGGGGGPGREGGERGGDEAAVEGVLTGDLVRRLQLLQKRRLRMCEAVVAEEVQHDDHLVGRGGRAGGVLNLPGHAAPRV